MTGTVFDIKEFSLHDGPGPRVTVFLKGCPLRCLWCHNPEGQSREPQLMVKRNLCAQCGRCRKGCTHAECEGFDRCIFACPNGLISVSGREYEAEALVERIMHNADFYMKNGGGVTISGGEPLMQVDFLCELLPKIGMHKALQTCGYAKPEDFERVVELCDFIMLDIKLADREEHKKYTGVFNDVILENFEYLKKSKKEYIIRTPLIPNITDTNDNLTAIEKLIENSPWEKLQYNEMAGAKYPMLGMKYKLKKQI